MCNICKAAEGGTSPYLIQSLGFKKRRTDQARTSVVLGADTSSKNFSEGLKTSASLHPQCTTGHLKLKGADFKLKEMT